MVLKIYDGKFEVSRDGVEPFPARYEEMLLGLVYSSSLLLYVKER